MNIILFFYSDHIRLHTEKDIHCGNYVSTSALFVRSTKLLYVQGVH